MKISLVLTLVQPGGVVGCLVIIYVQRFCVKKGAKQDDSNPVIRATFLSTHTSC